MKIKSWFTWIWIHFLNWDRNDFFLKFWSENFRGKCRLQRIDDDNAKGWESLSGKLSGMRSRGKESSLCCFHCFNKLSSSKFNVMHRRLLAYSVWKSPKKSHSTLRAKRATFTFWVDKNESKMPNMVHFREFLKLKVCGQTVLPDRSFLIGKTLVKNAKIT